MQKMALLGANKLAKAMINAYCGRVLWTSYNLATWLATQVYTDCKIFAEKSYFIHIYSAVQMFSQISRIPDLIRKFWAKRCGLYASVYSTYTTSRALYFAIYKHQQDAPENLGEENSGQHKQAQHTPAWMLFC